MSLVQRYRKIHQGDDCNSKNTLKITTIPLMNCSIQTKRYIHIGATVHQLMSNTTHSQHTYSHVQRRNTKIQPNYRTILNFGIKFVRFSLVLSLTILRLQQTYGDDDHATIFLLFFTFSESVVLLNLIPPLDARESLLNRASFFT